MLLICTKVSRQGALKYWDKEDVYPLVTHTGDGKTGPRYHVELIKAPLPSEKPLSPVVLGEEQLRKLRHGDHTVGGAIELDHFLSSLVIGSKDERKSCIGIPLAVDAKMGIVFPPELAPPGVSAGEALVNALVKAIETYRSLPQEMRVKNSGYKTCLQPIAEICGFTINVVRSLPALERARSEMLRMMGVS